MASPKSVLSKEGRDQLRSALKRLKHADAGGARRHLHRVTQLHPHCVEAWLLLSLLDEASASSPGHERLARAVELSGIAAPELRHELQRHMAYSGSLVATLHRLPELAASLLSHPIAPRAAWAQLFAAFEGCHGRAGGWEAFVDPTCLAAHSHRFKADVSFLFGVGRRARFSVNDKGEAARFREHLEQNLSQLDLDPDQAAAFFAVAPPGEVQTTLGLKYRGGEAKPERVSLYFEELANSPRGAAIRSATCALLGQPAPALAPGFQPNAVCVDYCGGRAVAVKCYDVTLQHRDTHSSASEAALPGSLQRIARGLPWHPETSSRRFMLAGRIGAGGRLLGKKLLFMTEAHGAAHAEQAFAFADTLIAQAPEKNEAVSTAYAQLRGTGPDATGHFFYPDLIGVNLNAEDGLESVVVHVSVR
ncbi:MAG TPA: hypothetical protein PKA88_08985 [Polyangiaceae bacterium]|nr:hypothetical protein [Polyangiaceae bacterium]HMR76006.1 hypothetical protein [Polyangiaceae bacterium]